MHGRRISSVDCACTRIRAASQAQPDAKALTVSVAAETLIEACYPQYTAVEQGLESEIDALERKIREDNTILVSLRKTVAGMVGSIRRPSSSRGLKVFIYTQACNRAKAKESLRTGGSCEIPRLMEVDKIQRVSTKPTGVVTSYWTCAIR
jgi:hypothetical protein